MIECYGLAITGYDWALRFGDNRVWLSVTVWR